MSTPTVTSNKALPHAEHHAITTDEGGYTYGLGESVRALRTYTGLSQVGMSIRLGCQRRSLQRIENGTEALRPGFYELVQNVVTAFDAEVDRILKAAGNGPVAVEVSDDPRQEWHRCAVSRAAALEPAIVVPVLIPHDRAREEHRR